jgi:hypothetical protein
MPARHCVPRLNPGLACFKLQIRASRIERFGVFEEQQIPRGKRVIEYTGKRTTEPEVLHRALRARKAGFTPFD